MKRKKRTTRMVYGIVLAVMLLLTLFSPAEAASYPAVYSKMSASYKSSVYYQRLMAVELTGNQITDLIQVASSQLGYHESSDKGQLDGSGTTNGNCTEYGNFTGTNGQPWCASFVSWCFREAGIPTSIMPTSAGCGTLRRSVYNNGATWHSVESGYKPKVGDLLLYEGMDSSYSSYIYASRDANGVPSASSHVGIVVSDFDEATQTFATIEGNGNGGCVKYLGSQKLNMRGPKQGGGTVNRVQGFVTPAYNTGTGSGYDGTQVDNSLTVSLTAPTDPAYTSKQFVSDHNATVVSRIYKSAGSSITQSGLILAKADGTVIKDHVENVTNVRNSTTVFHSWYDIQKELGVTLDAGTTYQYKFYAVVNGKTFYGNTYTFRTAGSAASYTISFQANGGTVSTSSKAVTTGDVYGELPIPTRDSYSFLGWYTNPDGGTMVTASTNVALTDNQTLYAHWELGTDAEQDDVVTGSDGSKVTFEQTDKTVSNGVASITKEAPELRARMNKPAGAVISDLRIYLYTPTGTRFSAFSASNHESQTDRSVVSFRCTLNEACLEKLTPGSIYQYEVQTVVDGTTYVSERWKFRLDDISASKEKPYMVSFVNILNMVVLDKTKVANGDYYTLPDPPEYSGMKFIGWFTSGGTQITKDTVVNLTGDQTLYAHWESLSGGEADKEGDTKERAVSVTLGQQVSGTLDSTTDVDFYRFTTGTGKNYMISVQNVNINTHSSSQDAMFCTRVQSESGSVLADVRAANGKTSESNMALEPNTTYYVRVSDPNKALGQYIFTVSLAQIDIRNTKVTYKSQYTYTGKAIRPTVKVTYGGRTLAEGTDYSVSYPSSYIKPGVGKLTIQGKGDYAGEITRSFRISPKKTTATVKNNAKGKLAVTIKKASGASGYEISYATSKKNVKKVKTTSLKKTLSVKKGKTYSVRVRSYKKVGSTYIYSAWSNSLKIKVKK